MEAVRDVHDVVQKDPLEPLEKVVFKNFYEQLYIKTDVDEGIQQSLLENIGWTSSEDQSGVPGFPVTVNELWRAVTTMKPGKVPGSDGIPVESYTCFWSSVESDLHDGFVSAFLSGCCRLRSAQA